MSLTIEAVCELLRGMIKQGITQKEIARRLGISQALVSRALTGTAAAIDASPATIERIRKACAEWGYSPNAAALTLKGAPTRTLGVIVKDFDDPFFGHLIGTLQGLAQLHHYGLFLVGWDREQADSTNEWMFRKYQPDGLIVCGSDYSPAAISSFLDKGKPVVQIGLGQIAEGVHQVGIDETSGLAALVDYLRSLGHTGIGYIGLNTIPQQRRESALRAALYDRHMTVRDEWFTRVDSLETDTPVAIKSLLHQRSTPPPTALIAADDVMAQRVMRVLHEQGVRVPDAMSLTGFDDIPAASAMIPSLTSMRQPLRKMVEHAFEQVTQSPAPEARGPTRIVVAPELIIRESCNSPRPIKR